MEENQLSSSLINVVVNDDDDRGQVESIECTKGGWGSSVCLIGVEVAERFAIYGASGNLITYLTNVMHEPMATAAKNLNVWGGVTTLLPLLGGFVADAYLGGYNTILISSVVYVMGLVMLTLSVSMVPVEVQHVPLYLSLYLISVGQGGHKPCVLPFGADQFDEGNPEEREAKSAFFNWWYIGTCVGASAGMLIVFYVQDNVGWVWGFAIPALAMGFALVIFLLGRGSYRQHVPSGSPLTRVMQVFVAASCKRHVLVKDGYGYVECCDDEEVHVVKGVIFKGRTLPRTNQFKFLDKATIKDDIDDLSVTQNNWRLCSVTQVEEVKLLLRLVPIWLSCLMYTLVFMQGGTFFTKQGSTMDTTITHNFHVSPASLQVSQSLVVILFVPIYDRFFIPIAKTFTGYPSGITMLQRVGFGMFLAIIEMVVAALFETRRVNTAIEHGLLDLPNATVPMSIWWLLPQYMIGGLSNAFTIVGLQELFYDQMPDKMRSIGTATYLSAFGVGSFLSSAVISIVQYVSSSNGERWLVDNLNLAHLDYYYWLLAGLSSLGLSVFIVVAKYFVYKKIDGVAPS